MWSLCCWSNVLFVLDREWGSVGWFIIMYMRNIYAALIAVFIF